MATGALSAQALDPKDASPVPHTQNVALWLRPEDRNPRLSQLLISLLRFFGAGKGHMHYVHTSENQRERGGRA